MGEALAALRRERGLSQAEAGQRIGMTSQGWGLYEAGRRPGLFRPDVQRRLTGALDATPEALALHTPGAPPASSEPLAVKDVSARGRAFAAAPRLTRRLRLETDELAPWAAAGTVLEYVVGRWPRRGQGCVIQLDDGAFRVRLYDHADDVEVVVGGAGGLDRSERIPRAQVRSVSAITARLDEE
ncbi:XRE family transcriptional regulator [Brevundimonas naejangsanensis]|uniref:XRE family transcriptional regulator n=1 Tax=Brevundimonas naejangsanensis TaxID=588932 RepID=A0A494RQC1_9CAUL|nr:XRE family transcriptional regulator [Brevundimonas naejangsanensis]